MDFLGKLSRLSRSSLVVTKGKSCRFVQVGVWPFVTNGHERVKDNIFCRFYCLYRWLQTVQYHFFRKFSNATAGIILQTLWNHSLHWLHCAFLTFHLLVEHMVRGIGSTIIHLKSQYHILQPLQLLWEMVLVFLFLGIPLGVV